MATTVSNHGRAKNKQYWKDEEADALVDVLQELACDPLWKVDGGFKNNYMVEVHKRLHQKISSCDKEVLLHIDSRIKYMKNKYNPISEMLMQSGCQWDDVENKINCEKQWYEDWCKNHKNAIGLWNFKFPYLSKLDLVWGKDRATGLVAEDISDSCEIPNDKNKATICSSSESEDDVVMVSDGEQSPPPLSTKQTSRKRKKLSPRKQRFHKKKIPTTHEQTIDAKLDDFAVSFKYVCSEMVTQFGVAASALTVGENTPSLSDEKIQDILNELINMGISHTDVGKVIEACYNDPNKVKTFFTLPIYMRRSYVLGFLYPNSSL